MTIIKFELDTIDLVDEIQDGESFEGLVIYSVKNQLQKEVTDKAKEEVTKQISDITCDIVKTAIDSKIAKLMEEPIVLSDRWGKKTFLGSVEDYIKRQIDERMLHPVDANGKILKGCTIAGQETWIEWNTKKIIEKEITDSIAILNREAERKLQAAVKTELKEVTTKIAEGAIHNAVGKLLIKD